MPPKPISEKIAIIILNWNGKEDTLHCLNSLKHLEPIPHEIIVVDNGSSDDSVHAIRTHHPEVTLIENSDNLGFAGGNNIGIRYALQTEATHLLLLNNDTEVDSHLLTAFMNHFRQHPEAGILGGKIHLWKERTLLDHWGGRWNPKKAQFDLLGLHQPADTPIPDEIDYVCGAALMAPRATWKSVGLLEERFFLIWEDSDFCFRAKKSGLQIQICPEAHLWHKVSASFVSRPHSTYFWWRNRLLWIERNCSPKERRRLYLKVLLPEIAHLVKIYCLKNGQLKLRRKLTPHKTFEAQEQKLHKNRAALQGIIDYYRGRFGNAPSWIYSPPSAKSDI